MIYNWTGFYIGGHVGGAFAGDNSLQGSDARFLGGVQGGFDYQFAPNWVIGVEAQYSWLTRTTIAASPSRRGTLMTATNDQLGSVTGRLGYTWGPALLYAKGGYAWRDNPNIGVTVAACRCAFTTDGNHQDGWTVGAGLEYMFAPNWSAKAEYQYYNFGNTTFTGRSGRRSSARASATTSNRQGRRELPLRLGRPGRRQILTGMTTKATQAGLFAGRARKGRLHCRPFCFGARSRLHLTPAKIIFEAEELLSRG